MKSSRRLKPIKKLADNKEKVAAQSLGKSVEYSKIQQDRLIQLVDYRVEYVNTMSVKTQQGMSGDRLQQYHQFLSKLDTLIEQQKLVVKQSSAQLSQCQNKWQSDNSRATAISKAMENMKFKEMQAADKKESAQIDEMSTQAFLRRKNL